MGAQVTDELRAEGAKKSDIEVTYQADVRYNGQAFEIPMTLELKGFAKDGLERLCAEFDAEHKRMFTFNMDAEHEVVNLRAVALGKALELPAMKIKRGTAKASAAKIRDTKVYIDGKMKKAGIYDREKLKAGNKILGPAIIFEMDSTALVHTGCEAKVDAYGNIIINPMKKTKKKAKEDDMGTKYVEKNKKKLKKVKVDPITLDLIGSALRNARVEMDATLFRTALSPGIREQGDAFPMIANRDGKMIVGQFGSFLDGFFNGFDGEIEEGDVILLNDPYSCEGAISHNNDQLVILPIFRNGRIISWASMFGHMTDIGGKVPGSMPNDAQSIFEEGIRIPPVKIYKKGEFQEQIVQIAAHNSRMPEWYKADLHAIIASCRVAEKRVNEICDRFGDDVYNSATNELLARNRRAMRQLIMDSIGEEPVSFEDYICDDGNGAGPFKIKCTMWRKGEKVHLDFDGTDPQSEYSINFYLNENMFRMFFGIYMVMVFDPQVLFNDGFYDLVEVNIPQGSLLKPNFPAALSCRTHALGRIFDVLGALLGQKTPDFLCAAGFSSSPHLMFSGFDQNNEWYQLFQIGFGGIPGKPFGDGPDGHSLWPDFTNVPNEFLERYFPMVIELSLIHI